MDAVLSRILDLHGTLKLENRPGRGCRFVISLPATVTTTQGLVLQVGDYRFGLPLDTVERILRVRPDEVGTLAGEQVLEVDGEPLSIASLASLVGAPEGEREGRVPTLILRVGETRFAVMVDDIPDQLPMVVKPLGPQFDAVLHLAGGALQADGSILPILDPRHLWGTLDRRQVVPGPQSEAGERESRGPLTVLVVDDSITTRTLERSILESAGYQVLIAGDGVEALELLSCHPEVEVVVTDIEMPRMNGLDLCRRIRVGPQAHLPVVVVTSLGSPEERLRGAEAGADAYLVKGNFQQDHFLGTIQRLVG